MACASTNGTFATASYIENMLAELRTMGQQIECDFLVYLLEMAMMESASIANGTATPDRPSKAISVKPTKRSAEELADLFLRGELHQDVNH